ncbi:MAG: hypothetical protein A2017_21460 [Lentisphaerae bacterium GWF2_44_16]|nr:MAG: hypothetical protein A2017_21460 [Lentisphaerae bacterium GWF2_44_16]
MKKNVLVAGCGSIGKRHALLLNARTDINIRLCDPVADNMDSICKEIKVEKTFVNYKDALCEKPDCVWICTPEALHSEMAVEALKLNIDVFCEKPVSDNISSAEKIITALKSSRAKMAVGYVLRYTKAYSSIKSLLDAGSIGNLVGAEVSLGAYDTLTCAKSDFYIRQPYSLILTYTHEFDYLRWFLGPVKEIIGFSNVLGNLPEKPSPNVAGAVLRFEKGPIATLMMDYIRSPGERTIRLTGDKGSMYYSSCDRKIYLSRYGVKDIEITDVSEERNTSFIKEHDNFFRYIAGEKAVTITVEDAMETLMTAQKLIDYMEK